MKKFVLLGHQRSGSTMVIGTLRKHPEITAFGELFIKNRIAFNVPTFENGDSMFTKMRNKNPYDFLNTIYSDENIRHSKAIGFKVFPDQLTDHFSSVWNWIQDENVSVIYLKRENLLATYVSLRLAIKTNKFAIKNEKERSSETITINPILCEKEFEEREKFNATIEEKITNNPTLHLSYETITANPLGKFAEIQDFLEVKHTELKIATTKQEVRPFDKIITNYEEVKKHFSKSKWSVYFQ